MTAPGEFGAYAKYMFAVMFTTLGPLKTIPVFHALTQERPFREQADLAIRAFVDASVLSVLVFLSAEGTLRRWGVSIPAITIAGGIILFATALRSITSFSLADLPVARPELVEKGAAKSSWLGRPVLSPLAVPTIVTPAGVVAILFFLGNAGPDAAYRLSIFVLITVMMLLNLAGMLLARPIMRLVGLPLLQVIGWVFSVLQAGLAAQAVISALRTLRALP